MGSENFGSPNGVLSEVDVAKKTGIGRDVLRVLRKTVLKEGADWILQDREVVLTREAAGKLVAAFLSLRSTTADETISLLEGALPTKDAVNEAHAQKNGNKDGGAEIAPPEIHHLVVWQVPSVNSMVLLARRPEDTSRPPKVLLTVRVQTSVNFVPGMSIYATHAGGRVYRLHGKHPRWRGEKLYKS